MRRGSGASLLTATLLLVGCSTAPTESPLPTSALSLAPVASSAVPSSPPASNGGLYLALGDSITYGIGVPRPEAQGFPAGVVRLLGDGPQAIGELDVVGVPGETAAGFVDRWLDDVVEGIGSRRGQPIDLVTVGLGANEVLRVRRSAPCMADRTSPECREAVDAAISEAGAALDVVVARLQEALAGAGSDARILLLAYYNPDSDPLAAAVIAGSDGEVGCDPSEARPGLDDAIACVAERRRAELVDLFATFRGRERQLTHIADGDIHPTVEGYRLIADAIVDVYLGRD
jgi:lysophospholipase L1-like esterase